MPQVPEADLHLNTYREGLPVGHPPAQKGMQGPEHCPRYGEDGFLFTIRDETNYGFCKVCDHCAFRPGSPERSDPERWEFLMQQIHLMGHAFYCHKGVPLARIADIHPSHVHPKTEDGRYDTARMRPCRGWLAGRRGRSAQNAQRKKPDRQL